MESIVVPLDSPRAGKSLTELNINRVMGVQVAGIQRHTRLRVNPRGDERIRPADNLLVLGSPDQIARFRRWLMPAAEAGS
jgi:CPA2 family monovalent cation:H+ antiporter-2